MVMPPSEPAGRTVHVSLLLLSFGSGAADAFAFLALGGIFTANMTGNLILSGMFSRPEFLQTFIGSVTAILAFAAFLYLGFRLTSAHRAPTNSPRATTWTHLLIGSIVLQAIVVLVWVFGWASAPNGQILAVALASAALALQTVAARRLSDRSGVTTTYVTGTLTSTMESLAERSSTGQVIRVVSILMLPLGAVCETVVIASAKWAGPILPLAVALAAAAAVVIAGRVRSE
ncbi:Uncharacterized membrane protein YoaK, UPF0700 family [Agreia pratensis]|uniref:Uncharacterized membrane protein YoaK, UPF0700 family n=2 Tax=Agreia pratensis TaxID=150121 RepID=A0A1X7KUA3_9MICO|nr:Uncharacterized membrane protein YoaK, UPF0700 family [Agreia pratensis]